MVRLVLFGRLGCHLCEVMEQELQPFLENNACELRVEDVDSRQAWQKAYGHLLPVLTDTDGNEICHYHLNEPALQKWFETRRQVVD